MGDLLVLFAAAELTIAVAAFAGIVGHAVWAGRRARRRREVRDSARRGLDRFLRTGGLDTEGLRPLERLGLDELLDLLGELAGTLAGVARRRVGALADELGVDDVAARRCRSRRWRRRLLGARLFTLTGGGEDVVADLFDDRHEEVRAQAAQWAAEHPSPEVVERMIALLDDPATSCRFTVKDSLLRLGRLAAPAVRGHLERGEGALVDALDVAAHVADASFLEPALALLDHPSADVQTRAVAVVGALGGERAVAALVGVLHSPNAEVRAGAARELGRLGQWDAAAAIAGLLHDAEWDVRLAAGTSLRRLGPAGMLLLRRVARDSDDEWAGAMARQVIETDELAARDGGRAR